MGDGTGEFWALVGTGIGMVVAAALLVLVGSVRDWLFRMVPRLTGRLKCYPDRKDAEQNHRIYTELVELRALTDADRAYVVRFHNGEVFLPDNHVWKVTCTHEVAKAGVTYEAARFQGVLVSRVHTLVDPLITGESSGPGVSLVAKCGTCRVMPWCAREN